MSTAGAVHRLAVLLEAGLTPGRAWEHLAAGGDADAAAVVAGAADGRPVAAVLAARADPWPQVSRAWQVAAEVGAPLAPSLRGIADALRDAQAARDEVRVALAEPATTARLVSWLPLLAVVLVVAFGFDVVPVLTQPVGIACLVAGLALIVLARRWTARLVARAQPDPRIPGLSCDLVAIALSGGVAIPRALAVVGDDAAAETATVLELSRASGAPAIELLRATAVDARRDARTEGRLRAAKLSGALLLPLGVCTLPAFLLLGVAPMLLSVLTATPLTL
ncbi:type II secretion system F family protein [Microbacterium sp. W1N]|uniref:type II secretion system F family protein n=1 Tax=Microbacterium festucae TaxID=2977531 RepID=UPI0021BDFC87|nr:type II secretion system F family protein [Microbacterium festucae]MCT9820999.1 type II secretion system F family protein [Microbacterium festucae]